MTDETKAPMMVKCNFVGCGHEWIGVYTPMEVGLFARVLSHTHCPMCGNAPHNVSVVMGKK